MSAPTCPSDLDVRIGANDGACAVTVVGDLDSIGAPVRSSCLEQLFDHPDVRAVELDLTGVTFLDAAGLTALARAHRSAERTGQALRMRCGTGRAVLRPLQLTGLAGRFTLLDAPP